MTLAIAECVVVRVCRVVRNWQYGGGLHNNGNLNLEGSLVHGNTKHDVYNSGTATYILPAPLGHYVEGVINCTQQLCCPKDLPGCTSRQRVQCLIQSCDEVFVGRLVKVLAQDILTDVAPKCPAGFYGNRTDGRNQGTARCAGQCPAGRICPREGTIDPLPVEPGFYAGLGSIDPQRCPLGHYCTGNTTKPAPCPAGTLGNMTGLDSSACSGPCPRGHYCSDASAAAVVCEDGTYGNGTGLKGPDDCIACPEGAWCNAGEAFPCTVGTFATTGSLRKNLDACRACPFNTTTIGSGHTSADGCVCLPQFYDDLDRNTSEAIDPKTGARRCSSCPLGFDCGVTGSTSRSGTVAPGFWRPSIDALEAKRCPHDYTCIGGASSATLSLQQTATCKANFSGPFCNECTQTAHYIDSKTHTCIDCNTSLVYFGCTLAGVVLVAAFTILAAGARASASHLTASSRLSWRRICATPAAGCRALAAFAGRAYDHPCFFGVRRVYLVISGKIKPVLGFALIVAQLGDVYQIHYPADYQTVTSVILRPFTMDLFGWVPALRLRCLGIAALSDELLLYALVPLGIVILTFSCVGLRHRSLVPALPFVLRLTFFFYPAVSSKGFQTLAPCDCFRMVNDSKLCFLPADYSVECVEYDAFGFGHHAPPNLLVLGLSAAVLFGLGVPLLYAGLLFACRVEIRNEKKTPLSAALAFLHSGLHPWALYWPFVEALRALLLTGILALVPQGTLLQLLLGLLLAFAFATLHMWCAPHRQPSDNFLAAAINVLLVLNFVSAVGVQMRNKYNDPISPLFLSIALYTAAFAILPIALLPLLNVCGPRGDNPSPPLRTSLLLDRGELSLSAMNGRYYT